MRRRTRSGDTKSRLAGATVLAVVATAAGCGSTKPCMVIPAQLSLARDVRDQSRAQVDEQQRAVERWTSAIQQSRTRLEKLQEERDQLRKEVSGSEGGEATEGKDSKTEEKK